MDYWHVDACLLKDVTILEDTGHSTSSFWTSPTVNLNAKTKPMQKQNSFLVFWCNLYLILSSSTITLFSKLQNFRKYFRNLHFFRKISKILSNFESIFVKNVNFESIFEKFVISKKMSMVDEVTIRTIVRHFLKLHLFKHVVLGSRKATQTLDLSLSAGCKKLLVSWP